MKAIQYREDGKFYGFYKPEQPDNENYGNEMQISLAWHEYKEELKECIAAGKEIINPEVMEIGNLVSPFTHLFNKAKDGIFDLPSNVEFDEKYQCKYCRGDDWKVCPESQYISIREFAYLRKVIRLKLKDEMKTEEENALKLLAALQVKEESQNELWNEVAISFMNKYSKPAIEENKSKFTITRK